MISRGSVLRWCCLTPLGSSGVTTRCLCLVLMFDSPEVLSMILTVSCVASLMGWETFMQTKCFEQQQKQRARIRIQKY